MRTQIARFSAFLAALALTLGLVVSMTSAQGTSSCSNSSHTRSTARFSSDVAGIFSDRIGSRRLVFSLPFLAIAVMFLLPFRVTGWQLYALLIVMGLVVGAIPTATFAAAPEIMGKPELAGIGLAVIIMCQNLGMFVGPILFGVLAQSFGWITAGSAMIPLALAGFVFAWRVKVR